MTWILKYAPEYQPERAKIVARTYATKEEALASIPTREAVRGMELLYGRTQNYTGPVVWIVEPISAIESAQLVTKLKEVENETPQFAR